MVKPSVLREQLDEFEIEECDDFMVSDKFELLAGERVDWLEPIVIIVDDGIRLLGSGGGWYLKLLSFWSMSIEIMTGIASDVCTVDIEEDFLCERLGKAGFVSSLALKLMGVLIIGTIGGRGLSRILKFRGGNGGTSLLLADTFEAGLVGESEQALWRWWLRGIDRLLWIKLEPLLGGTGIGISLGVIMFESLTLVFTEKPADRGRDGGIGGGGVWELRPGSGGVSR